MKKMILAVFIFTIPAAAGAALRPERIILRTDAGDLVLALYDSTPQHAKKLLGLMSDGSYDSAPLLKINSRFVGFGGIERRRTPLSPKRLKAIKRLPVETDGGLHRAGVMVMAHQPGDPDESGTAFIILLVEIPAMKGRFSAVGEVIAGSDVLEALKSVPVDGESRPVRPLEIKSTSVISRLELSKTTLNGPDERALGRDNAAARRRLLLLLAVFGLTLGAGLHALRPQLGAAASSLALLSVLAGFFAAFTALADLSASSAWISIPLFVSTIAVFRLMGRFERSDRTKHK